MNNIQKYTELDLFKMTNYSNNNPIIDHFKP